MDRSVAAGLLAALLLASAVSPIGTAFASQPESADSLAVQQEFDRTKFIVHVYENGSARWTLEYSQPLANETERREFRQFADRFNSNETELYTDFQDRADRLAADGESVTGREMDATGYSKRAYVDDTLATSGTRGIVSMSFTWTNFARTEGDRLQVGDVFEGGLYIGPNQSLVIERGDSLAFTDVAPPPDKMAVQGSLSESDSVTWEGEREFADNRPYVELVPNQSTGNGTAANGSGDGDQTSSPSEGQLGFGGLFSFPMVAGFFLLLLGGVVVYVYRNGALGDGSPAAETGADGPDGGSGSDGGTTAAPEPAISDEELLSDEDRVMKLLEERGGRMKQVNIVEETGWSKSKVSMLLSEMEDDESISKLRVGRENIVSIAGQEPEAAGSPFDDEE